MTKEQFQQELSEKVKPGVKPSDLKKLKKSKSADDISSAPSPTPLTRSKSAQELEPTLTKENLETKISVLNLEIEVKNRELTEKDGTITIHSDQLKEKQKELEELRKKLEEKNEELKTLKAEHSTLLDDNLTLKHQSLKDWWRQYQQTKELDQELKENVDEASQELLEQDETINHLRSANTKLQQTNQSLQKDLNLATKLAELRKNPYYSASNDNFSYLKYALYSLLAVSFTLFLVNNFKQTSPQQNHD